MPIYMGDNGSSYTIQRLTGSGEVKAHLNSMGFNPGTEVRLVSKLSGNVILAVKDTRVAINAEEARHILV
ncbi:MAG TPA: ferrous iron transport protein A [Candidatus Avilachnospira avistercoris]|nr:ferrous iron transport protein A [Candidatus Avilachnospira avistercoris]